MGATLPVVDSPDTPPAAAPTATPEPRAGSTRWPAPRRLATVAVVLILIAGIAWLGWTWRHPDVFPEAGGWGVRNKHFPIGEPLYVGMSYEDETATGTITVESARARVVTNTADAKIEFFVCVVDPASGVGSVGAVRQDDFEDECPSATPVEGAALELKLNATPREEVVIAVTLSHAGQIQIEGFDLTYSRGWQHGTQHIGGEVDLANNSQT